MAFINHEIKLEVELHARKPAVHSAPVNLQLQSLRGCLDI